MKKFRSIFWRYLTINTAVVLSGFLLLAVFLPVLVSSNAYAENMNTLDRNGKLLSDIVSKNLINFNGEYDILTDFEMKIDYLIEALNDQNDSEVFVTDKDGVIQYIANNSTREKGKESVPVSIINECISRGSLNYVGNLGELYSEKYYITCNIILRPDQEIYGVVFVNAPSSKVTAFRNEILQSILLTGLAAVCACFAAVWLFTNQMTLPLLSMEKAVKKFGDGDLSSRVETRGEDEIARLGKAFNNMADSLSADEGMRKSFVANVSHELRTPMTTISGFVDGMIDGTIPEEKNLDYLKIVSDETKRLSRLIRTMLDLSRIDSDTLELRYSKMDIRDTILTALLSFETKIDQKNATVEGLENSRPIRLEGDEDLLHQVIYNLIENAVKFVNPGGVITIKLSENKSNITVKIRNTGSGLPPEELARIFERFYKTDKSRSQDAKGLGLGLYIVKTVIRLHKGSILVRSEVNSHTEFEFTLPKKVEKKG